MSEELKPCPFCGMRIVINGNYASHPFNKRCILSSRNLRKEYGEWEVWNTRQESEE